MFQSCLHKKKKKDQISKDQSNWWLSPEDSLGKDWSHGATTTDFTHGMPGNLPLWIILFRHILLSIKELQAVYKQAKAQINYLLANTYNT